MLNVILKAFNKRRGGLTMDEAFRDRPIGTCISINDSHTIPSFKAQKHVWMHARQLRDCKYPDVDWKAIPPPDEELIEKMQHCENQFMLMIERYARVADIPYLERKRQYLEHLRYWDHLLDREKIGLFLLFHAPHQCYDYVIYELCKLKGIKTLSLEHCYSVDGIFVQEDYEKSTVELVPALQKVREEYKDPNKEIPLWPSFDRYFRLASERGDRPKIVVTRPKHLQQSNFFAKWWGRSLDLLKRSPGRFFWAVISPEKWTRKLNQHRTALYYDANVDEHLDLEKPFVYVPLHCQPEESTAPRGGAFVHQELMIQMLASLLPPGVMLYVKEHPGQGELFRSIKFYKFLLQYPNVRFVPRPLDTFELIRNSAAVATVTGTAGFEALFMKKPVFMFGHRFYQYAPGVHHIHSTEDCRKAIESVFIKKETFDLREIRMFLKAIQDICVHYYEKPTIPEEVAGQDEQVRELGRYIRKITEPLYS